MISRIDCACGNHLAITHARLQPIQDAEWEVEGWEKMGETWVCWQCLGKPMPASLLEAIRGRELDELCAQPGYALEDCQVYLDRLYGAADESEPK